MQSLKSKNFQLFPPSPSVFQRILDSQSSNPTEPGRWLWIGFSVAQTPPKLQTSLYGFVLLCERYYCHLFLLDRDIPEQKKQLEMVNERSDEEKEAHWETRSGVRGQGSESDRKKHNFISC